MNTMEFYSNKSLITESVLTWQGMNANIFVLS